MLYVIIKYLVKSINLVKARKAKLTRYNNVFNVIVESANSEITAKSQHLNGIEFVGHVEQSNEN